MTPLILVTICRSCCLLTSTSFPLWLGHLAWYPNCFKAERNGTNIWRIWRVIKDPTESRRSLAPSHLDGHLYLSGWTVSDETSEIHALISLIAHFGRMFSLARRLLAQAEGLTIRWSASGVSGVGLGGETRSGWYAPRWKHTLPLPTGWPQKRSKKWNTWYIGDKECCYWIISSGNARQ